jgi:hypothetical protein
MGFMLRTGCYVFACSQIILMHRYTALLTCSACCFLQYSYILNVTVLVAIIWQEVWLVSFPYACVHAVCACQCRTLALAPILVKSVTIVFFRYLLFTFLTQCYFTMYGGWSLQLLC